MKNFLFLIVFSFSISFAIAQGFVVKNFSAEITLSTEGYFDVVEKYDVVFTEYKHGIIRNILTKYTLDGEKREIYISDIKVPGHKFSTPPGFISKLNKQIEIKIGDADKEIIGPQHYEISYRVKNAILFDNDFAMLYWNLKPDGWFADFEKINFKIIAPEGAKLSAENSFVYSGLYGNTEVSPDFSLTFSGNTFSAQNVENRIFYSNENVTVLVKLPKDMIANVDYSPSAFIKYGWIGILGIFLAYFLSVWRKYGKDDRAIPVTSYYPPKGIDPAMAGYLINDSEDASDLISLIPKWGQEGLIRLVEIPKSGIFSSKDTQIIKLKEIDKSAPDYEKTMFEGLFSSAEVELTSFSDLLEEVQKAILGKSNEPEEEKNKTEFDTVLISSLKDSFYTTMNEAKKQLKDRAKVYYEPKSEKIMTRTIWFSILGLFFIDIIFLFVFGLIAALISGLFFIFLIIFSGVMRKKTKKGTEILSELKGFRQFIKLAEVDRIKTLIESDPDYFEKTMSYALSFGLLEKWADKFADLNVQPPDWYSGSTVGMISMHGFSKSFSSSMASTQSAMVSSPSSSSSGGGGSSGGGFGGGGGGSW